MIDIRKEGLKYFSQHFNFEVEKVIEMFDSGIIHESIIIKCLIKDEYFKKIKPKNKTSLQRKLAEKYCISEGAVKRIIYDKNFQKIGKKQLSY